MGDWLRLDYTIAILIAIIFGLHCSDVMDAPS